MEGALLWILWHHQGGSPDGRACRRALGMGEHDRMTEEQLAIAKKWGAARPGLSSGSAQLGPMFPADRFVAPVTDLMVDAAMVEMGNVHPPLRRSECERLINAALSCARDGRATPG